MDPSLIPPPILPQQQTSTLPINEPLRGVLPVLDALLRDPSRLWQSLRGNDCSQVILILLSSTVACVALYGLVVGSFSKGMQLWAAPVKLIAGLLGSTVLCLPSLYIFASMSGVKTRLSETFGMAAGLLTQNSLLLAGFAPVAWVFSESTDSAAWMGAMHLGFWFVACRFGFRFVLSGFQNLKPHTLAGIRVWLFLFMIVALQMSTALRPIVGTSDDFLPKEKRFFLKHWMLESHDQR